jgi:hypothetical protein
MKTMVLVATLVAAAMVRVVPHPANFAPITAMALFGGAYFARRWLAFVVPLAALLLSDCALELTTRVVRLYPAADWLATGVGFYRGMWTTYAAFALVVCIGLWLRGRRNVINIAAATFASSLLFYLVTNFAAWMDGAALYPRTVAGLLACYWAGLPFFGNTLLGDFTFVIILFGGFALAERFVPSLRPEAAPGQA